MQSIFENSCTSLGPSLRDLVGNFHASLNKSVDEVFRASSIGSQFHDDIANNGITLRFLKVAALEDGDGFTESEDVFDPPADPEVIKIVAGSFFRPFLVKPYFLA